MYRQNTRNQKKQREACKYFKLNNSCKFGKNCHFLHEEDFQKLSIKDKKFENRKILKSQLLSKYFFYIQKDEKSIQYANYPVSGDYFFEEEILANYWNSLTKKIENVEKIHSVSIFFNSFQLNFFGVNLKRNLFEEIFSNYQSVRELNLSFCGMFLNGVFSKKIETFLSNLDTLESLKICFSQNEPFKNGNSDIILGLNEDLFKKKLKNLSFFSIELDCCNEISFSMLINNVFKSNTIKKLQFWINDVHFNYSLFIKYFKDMNNEDSIIKNLETLSLNFYSNKLNSLLNLLNSLKISVKNLNIELKLSPTEIVKIYNNEEDVMIELNNLHQIQSLNINFEKEELSQLNPWQFSNFYSKILSQQQELIQLKVDLSNLNGENIKENSWFMSLNRTIISNSNSLKEISLAFRNNSMYANICKEFFNSLDSLSHKGLEKLSLFFEGNLIGNYALKCLAYTLDNFKKLEFLNLDFSKNRIRDIQPLCYTLLQLPLLHTLLLDFSFNTIMDEGINSLFSVIHKRNQKEEIQKLVNLQLGFARNGISIEGVKKIAESLRFCQIQNFDIDLVFNSTIMKDGVEILLESLENNFLNNWMLKSYNFSSDYFNFSSENILSNGDHKENAYSLEDRAVLLSKALFLRKKVYNQILAIENQKFKKFFRKDILKDIVEEILN